MDLSSKYTEDLDNSLRRRDGNNEADHDRYSLRVQETIGEATPKTCQELIIKSEESKINQKWKKSRERNEELWERNIKKRARLSGSEYINASNKVVPKKECILTDCTCPLKCYQNISTEQRMHIFSTFYQLSSWEEQCEFLVASMKQIDKKRCYTKHNSRREKSRLFFLIDDDGNDVRVCKKTFQNTLRVSSGRIDRLIRNAANEGLIRPDLRGRHAPGNKTKIEDVEFLRDLAKQFPTRIATNNACSSHLVLELTKKELYERYKNECILNSKKTLSLFKFVDIVTKDCKLSFQYTGKAVTNSQNITMNGFD